MKHIAALVLAVFGTALASPASADRLSCGPEYTREVPGWPTETITRCDYYTDSGDWGTLTTRCGLWRCITD